MKQISELEIALWTATSALILVLWDINHLGQVSELTTKVIDDTLEEITATLGSWLMGG